MCTSRRTNVPICWFLTGMRLICHVICICIACSSLLTVAAPKGSLGRVVPLRIQRLLSYDIVRLYVKQHRSFLHIQLSSERPLVPSLDAKMHARSEWPQRIWYGSRWRPNKLLSQDHCGRSLEVISLSRRSDRHHPACK